jgi:hypothetical protein
LIKIRRVLEDVLRVRVEQPGTYIGHVNLYLLELEDGLLLYTFQLGEEGLPTSQGSGGLLYSVAVFDGDNFRVPVGIKMEGEDPDEAYLQSSAVISRLVDKASSHDLP